MSKRVLSYVLVVLVTLVLSEAFHPLTALQTLAQGNCQTFDATGKTVCGRFLQYWNANGGLAQQGYPITGAFQEVSDLNGQSYTVQYFERAVFESHPENQPPNDVELSQLGTFRLKEKYGGNDPALGGQPVPTIPPAQPPAQPTQPPSQPPSTAFHLVLAGTGNQVTANFQLKKAALRSTSVCSTCADNFIAWIVDAKTGADVDLLANVIGSESSSTITQIDSAGSYAVRVQADGDWTITLDQQ